MSRNNSFLLSNPSNQNSVLAEGQLSQSRDSMSMGSDLFLNQSEVHEQQGLARYRSAPSSFLAALLDPTTENSSSGDESDALFSALMDGDGDGDGPPDLNQKSSSTSSGGIVMGNQMHYHLKQEVSEPRPGPYESAVSGGGGAIVGSYDNRVDLRLNNGNVSNLLRQSSSPAGFFNGGYGIMGEVGNYKVHAKGSSSAAGGMGMNNHMNFSSAPSSSSRFMPSIPENVNESMSTRVPENVQLGRANSANAREFEALFPQDSWNDTTTFNGFKRTRDDDVKMFSNFNGLESGETRKNPHGLIHHLSLPLPKTSSEMAEVEKFLQFQPDTTPCQIRAKRGCATHPRSIAERVRRTRISEKMKKLQDLFPNMDKQTSTADMLDLSVQFIKDLQTQVETLTEMKAKCVCSNKHQHTSPNS